jgi:Membrane protease subunits, stomatin/prohibitin homologs
MKAGKFILPIVILIAATLFFSIFIVKEVNQAIVLQFGDPKRIILKPGLNFKIPFIKKCSFFRQKSFKFRKTAGGSNCIRSKTFNC